MRGGGVGSLSSHEEEWMNGEEGDVDEDDEDFLAASWASQKTVHSSLLTSEVLRHQILLTLLTMMIHQKWNLQKSNDCGVKIKLRPVSLG